MTLSKMSPTFLPFLYQTRTLQHLCRGRAPTALRSISTTSTSQERQRFKRDAIPFELPPGHRDSQKTSERRARASAPGPRSTITPTERAAFDRIFGEIAARGKPPRDAHDEPSRPSPADLSSHETVDATTRSPQLSSWTGESAEAEEGSDSETKGDIINVIMQDATQQYENVRRTAKRPFDPLHPLEQVSASGEPNLAYLRFPPGLREAAGIALSLTGKDKFLHRTKPSEQPDTSVDGPAVDQPEASRFNAPELEDDSAASLRKDLEMEAQRRVYRVRIQKMMNEAKSDFALWDIMERELFTMVERLGLAAEKKEEPAKRRRRKRSGSSAASSSKDEEMTKAKLTMDVHGPLYPELLLFGLRQMDQAFASSSPLALSILPRIKELGLSSYVLGISTSFYVQLMQIQWYRYGDFAAVLNLLEEMRHAGLAFDRNCLGVLDAVEGFYTESRNGVRKEFLKQLMWMPEFEHTPTRIKHWRNEIMRNTE